MTSKVTLEQVQALAAELSPGERASLAQWLLEQKSPGVPAPRTDWMSVRGVAPGLLGGGEDAQHWVSRTRQESDTEREKALKPCP